MTPIWSPHAKEQLADILRMIAEENTVETAEKWAARIQEKVELLDEFPDMGDSVPASCFFIRPAHLERLHQIIVRPYRILYEVIDGVPYIYSVRHGRMLMDELDIEN